MRIFILAIHGIKKDDLNVLDTSLYKNSDFKYGFVNDDGEFLINDDIVTTIM